MKKCNILVFISMIFLLSLLCPKGAELRAENIDKREKKIISQIKSYYTQGKKSLARKKFLTAIAKFNRVIELEEDFYIVYTPYAKEYIRQAQEKISEKERMNVKLDIKKEPKGTSKSLEYTIGEADVLYVSVWQEETLSQEVIVRPDGKISFPLAGDIPAAGLTFAQLRKELSQKLKEYIKYPLVSISLKKLGGRKVIVLGEVGSAGVYSVTGKSTLLEAIGMAGGFTSHAVPSSIILIRGGLRHPEGRRLNLTRAIDKGDYSQNVVLQSEDIIYIPKKFIANVNYAVTQILGPISKGVATVSAAQQFEGW